MNIKDLKYKKPNDVLILGDKEYDLSHLKPEIIILNAIKVYVQYTTHTWTQKRKNTDTPTLFVDYKRKGKVNKRTFDLERYESSKNLKNIIRNLKPNDKLLKSTGDWFFVRNGLYHVFMNIRPSYNPRYDYIMIITSAHYRDCIENGNPKALKYILK